MRAARDEHLAAAALRRLAAVTRIGSWHDEDPADRGEKQTTELRRDRCDGDAYERRQ